MTIASRPPFLPVSALRLRAGVPLAALRAIVRTLLNRRAAYRVAELPDYLLHDIGLKRDDVHAALNAHWREDPTFRMAMAAHRGRDARLKTRRRSG